MSKLRIYLFIFLFISGYCYAQVKHDLIEQVLKNNSNNFSEIIENPDKFKIQIIYTQINRDGNNLPTFQTYKYNVNKDKYFYPASTVKLPAALLALEKLKALSFIIDRNTQYYIDSDYYNSKDSTGKISHNYFTLANDVAKIFLVSDNEAFNHLYEFAGQKEINEALWIKRYSNVKLLHRLARTMSNDQNRLTYNLIFEKEGRELFSTSKMVNEVQYKNYLDGLKQGKGYYQNGELINEEMDFTFKNYFSIEDQHEMLVALIFPENVAVEKRFNIREEDRVFLLKHMSMFPRESGFKEYADEKKFPDNYVKFFYHKDMREENLRIFNKVGLAYGYMIDNAYIVDFDKGIEFFLSAVIYVNDDEIFNDDKYEYDEKGGPFLENLGKALYEYEKIRPKMYVPDLKAFKFKY